MEPPPPPDPISPKPDPVRPWVGLCVWAVMFAGCQLWGGCQRDEQAAELKRQGREIADIKAMMMEQQKRRE